MDLIELMRASTFTKVFECHKKIPYNEEDYYFCTNENGENGLIKIIKTYKKKDKQTQTNSDNEKESD